MKCLLEPTLYLKVIRNEIPCPACVTGPPRDHAVDLVRLREKTEAATQGDWNYDHGNCEVERKTDRAHVASISNEDDRDRSVDWTADGEYVAAYDPPTTDALLTIVENQRLTIFVLEEAITQLGRAPWPEHVRAQMLEFCSEALKLSTERQQGFPPHDLLAAMKGLQS